MPPTLADLSSQQGNGDVLWECAPIEASSKNLNRADRFDYKGWCVCVESADGGLAFSGHANLLFDGKLQCRLVLATDRSDHAAARSALEGKARSYIDGLDQTRRMAPNFRNA